MGVVCIFLSHLGKLGLEAPITDIVIVSKTNVYQEKKHLREAAFDFNIVRAI